MLEPGTVISPNRTFIYGRYLNNRPFLTLLSTVNLEYGTDPDPIPEIRTRCQDFVVGVLEQKWTLMCRPAVE